MLMQQQQQQPIHGFMYVTGVEGARAYPMPPNSEMPLFDSSNDGTIYVKTTDAAGFPTIKRGKVIMEDMAQQPESSSYVTHDEFQRAYSDLSGQVEQMKGVIYGSVSQTAAEQPAGTNAKHSTTDGR